ncbi:MAG: epoxide hydrolase family protein [Acidimicrobiales bacterium]
MPDLSVQPFVIDVAESVLDDLRRRLRRARWPEEMSGTPWQLGTDRAYLEELVDYWATGFDWRRIEAELNRFDQYTTEVDGQRIHFVHQRAANDDALPIVLLSGWPSTFAEFAKVTPRLIEGTPQFHVVAPSLPGFGFSGPTTATGWTPRRIAVGLAEVMRALGYERYGAHGGDWGAMVSSQLGLTDPAHCIGVHLSMVIAPKPADPAVADDVTEQERAELARMYAAGRDQMGYQRIQSTRPQTLSASLMDSPLGLAAWIVEKYRAWSDCDGDIETRFTKDELLTNLTIYWVTGTIASANRIYAETRLAGFGASLPDAPVRVPMGYVKFPGDAFKPPRRWVEELYDIRRWSEVDEGGHFPALETPELLSEEIRRFFGGLE